MFNIGDTVRAKKCSNHKNCVHTKHDFIIDIKKDVQACSSTKGKYKYASSKFGPKYSEYFFEDELELVNPANNG